ncbi:hypothetical protein D9M68_499340 [compost metagenome]
MLGLGIDGVVPGARGQLHHAGQHAVRKPHDREAGPAPIEKPHQVAIGDAPRGGVPRMQGTDFPALSLLRHAVRAEIQLAVQAGGRLVGNQEQRMRRRGRVLRRQPGGMARAVRITEARHHRRTDLDLAAGRGQRVGRRIVAEGPQDAAVVFLLREDQFAALPELVEIRRLQALAVQRRAGLLIQVAQPFAAAAAFGEGLARAEPGRQVREDVVVVAREPVGLGQPVHGHHQGVRGRAPDIVAFQRHRARQHDVGVARRGRPADLVHHEGVQGGEGALQTRQVLVMVKGIAARPIGQADMGIRHALAVVVEGFPGMQQHVGDARHRDEGLHAVHALRQRRYRHGVAAFAVMRQGAKRIRIAAARQAQLAQRGGQDRPHPDRLFAVLGALQRMRYRDQHALARQASGNASDPVRGHAANRRGPGRRLGLAILPAQQVVFENGPAIAEFIQEGLVVQAVGNQFVHQRQHQRHVRPRHGAHPFGLGVAGEVGG